jgi:hypothetical protein
LTASGDELKELKIALASVTKKVDKLAAVSSNN